MLVQRPLFGVLFLLVPLAPCYSSQAMTADSVQPAMLSENPLADDRFMATIPRHEAEHAAAIDSAEIELTRVYRTTGATRRFTSQYKNYGRPGPAIGPYGGYRARRPMPVNRGGRMGPGVRVQFGTGPMVGPRVMYRGR